MRYSKAAAARLRGYSRATHLYYQKGKKGRLGVSRRTTEDETDFCSSEEPKSRATGNELSQIQRCILSLSSMYPRDFLLFDTTTHDKLIGNSGLY